MSAALRLVLFDVDGTLVDSQGDIVASMTAAFGALGHPVPPRDAVLGIVGLSLPEAMARLAPGLGPDIHAQMVAAYKDSYVALRATKGVASSPLYPGALAALQALAGRDDVLLGVATGKSRRGLDALFDSHGLRGTFVTEQVADHHPSKPHPSMVLTAMAETGVEPRDTVVIGDTVFDMEMAQAAGVHGIGVGWGYHPRTQLQARAASVIDGFDALPAALDRIWGAGA
ncbi:HAD-IA family hydrolase [Lutimaribacter sp. EGI FJ00015]|uniref:HAD-IA family hydrolase n=1 Tax=Lutimaribacter degradans TaxID=2945989 RepID=A0ACC5ZY07_9RHOB|nr:HAD-IA family hydrolase [Lutimaribacter sp. EGI FJ00013]MCM2563216.1 HAD-IA family hydrolase [Lutimaribacter sp. EGI FJ00013]MCO0614461.1 HAD-IA family hydrolase [Lutimaribacter sp. EGI FJ00015]MCO0635938.1 HAD-IA family hydrolase [Lutimaribacter sp. EGI FJ00014]